MVCLMDDNIQDIKLGIGSTLYYVNSENSINEARIISEGRKYYTIKTKHGNEKKVNKETLWYENSNFSQLSIKFYLRKQDILDGLEKTELLNYIRESCSIYAFQRYTNNDWKDNMDSLRKIASLMGWETKTEKKDWRTSNNG